MDEMSNASFDDSQEYALNASGSVAIPRFYWTAEEDELLLKLSDKAATWVEIATHFPNKIARQCRLRFDRLKQKEVPVIRAGPWTKQEDALVNELVEKHGKKWADIAREFSGRTAEQIRGRYIAVLDPAITRDPWTKEEHRKLLFAHYELGNHWIELAKVLAPRMPKQIQYHYTGAVSVKTRLYLDSKGKNYVTELTEDELEELLMYLENRRGLTSLQKKLEPPAIAALDETVNALSQEKGLKKKTVRASAGNVKSMGKPTYAVHRAGDIASSPAPSTALSKLDTMVNAANAINQQQQHSLLSSSSAAAVLSNKNLDSSDSEDEEEEERHFLLAEENRDIVTSPAVTVAGDVVHTSAAGESFGEAIPVGEKILDNVSDSSSDTNVDQFLSGNDAIPSLQSERQKKLYKIWTPEEDEKLVQYLAEKRSWAYIANELTNKTSRQCRVRASTALNPNIKTGSWSPEEDQLLLDLVDKHGCNWYDIGKEFGTRTSEQLRGRYNNSYRKKGLHTPIRASLTPKKSQYISDLQLLSGAVPDSDSEAEQLLQQEIVVDLSPEAIEERARRNREIAAQVAREPRVDENTRRLSRATDDSKIIWTVEEDILLQQMADQGFTFPQCSSALTNKSEGDCRKRLNYLRRYGTKEPGIKKYSRPGPWAHEDDLSLLAAVEKHGKKWYLVSQEMANGRNARQASQRFKTLQSRGSMLEHAARAAGGGEADENEYEGFGDEAAEGDNGDGEGNEESDGEEEEGVVKTKRARVTTSAAAADPSAGAALSAAAVALAKSSHALLAAASGWEQGWDSDSVEEDDTGAATL